MGNMFLYSDIMEETNMWTALCAPQKPPSDSESLQKFMIKKLIKINLEVRKFLKNFGVW